MSRENEEESHRKDYESPQLGTLQESVASLRDARGTGDNNKHLVSNQMLDAWAVKHTTACFQYIQQGMNKHIHQTIIPTFTGTDQTFPVLYGIHWVDDSILVQTASTENEAEVEASADNRGLLK